VTERRLRVASYNVAGLTGGVAAAAAVLKPLRPDVVVVQDGPWRLRWRTPIAQLAGALGLVHGGGGRDSVGNAILVSVRVDIDEVTPVRFPLAPGQPMRGAIVAEARVGGARFVVAGARLADATVERLAQRTALVQALSGITRPLVVCGDLGAEPLDGLVDTSAGRVDPAAGGPRGVILASQPVRLEGWELGEPGPTGYRPVVVDLTLSATN
jgi:endonuclease/exonuclease/phosphatase family metal-dependent hydrolase